MTQFFQKLFTTDFMPHGTCYLWDPAVLWLNVISDAVIASAYYAIPILLFRFARARRDITFKWIFVAFGAFILACGSTHLLGAVTAWVPVYRLDGIVKAITAVASVMTFAMLIPMMPVLISLPSPSELARINKTLAREIEERRAAEEKVRSVNDELERRVQERTAELVQSESRFRQLAEAMPQMVWVADSSGGREYFNRQWFEYTGATFEGSRGTGWADSLHPDDRARTLERWQHSMRTGEEYEVECRFRRYDGEYHWFLGRATPVFDSDQRIVKWFGTSTDIDDQKRQAQSLQQALDSLRSEMDQRRNLEDQLLQAQKMEAIGRLAGGVAHDFNNLLTAILGYNEMVRDEVKDRADVLEFVDEVRRAAERATALTNQLLAFSRRQVAQPRLIDLNQVVGGIEKMLRRIIGEDILLETRLAPDVRPVRVDPSHIDQVIMNMSVNSRDAMPNGGKLTVETANVKLTDDFATRYLDLKPGHYSMLAVSDNGVGMDADTRARIFEPFFTTKGSGRGTGLGLSIVYGIVKQNGGEILVYSEPGRGTTFKIYLPAVDAPAPAPEPQRTDKAAGGTERILLVEDEELVRNLARTMLTRQGYHVEAAGSSEEAMRILRDSDSRFDLLLTDVVMPEVSGVELAEMARRLRPDLKVLYMSGYTEGGILHHGVLEPDAPFIQKPFSTAALNAKVREVLKG